MSEGDDADAEPAEGEAEASTDAEPEADGDAESEAGSTAETESAEESGVAAEESGTDSDADAEESDAEDQTELTTVEPLEDRLDEAEAALEGAETEADLDEVEATLDAVAADLAAADLPEPDEDDEDADDPAAAVEQRLEELRSALEEQRGPYAEDVVAAVDSATETITGTRWTEQGIGEVATAVDSFAETVGDLLDVPFDIEAEPGDGLTDALDVVAAAVSDAGLDPDEDADLLADLVAATDDLEADLEDAQEWDDLQVHEQLAAEGFYDVLGHIKDFPPEWAALKVHEEEGNVEMILMALEMLGSDFMERHCLEALTRMNDPRAFEAMHERAGRRDKPGIRALGKMGQGAEEAVETLLEYVDTDSDPGLQKVTFKALGEIGSEEATQALANKLAMDDDAVRPHAARALGLVGDTRAVDPLADVVAEDDSDTVRAAAAWALRQIGTREALEAAAEHADDRSYLVQYEAEQAAEALDADEADADAAPA
jgi:hypothetical protein